MTEKPEAIAIEAGQANVNCLDCGVPIEATAVDRDARHDHCGPLPHTGPIGGPYCEKCE